MAVAPLPLSRDCPDCGKPDGLKLQNVIPTPMCGIPLLYICEGCGLEVTIPPPLFEPIPPSPRTDHNG
jgi:hypothetical protein